MTKICPNCDTKNIDRAGFCQNCGFKLKNLNKGHTPPEKQGWWDKQSNGKKAGIGLAGVCCIGVLIIIIAGSFLTPDNISINTTNASNSTSNSNNVPNTNIYEDEYVKFNVPSTITILKLSNATETSVDFFKTPDTNNKDIIGELHFFKNNLSELQKTFPDGHIGQFKDYRTWEGEDEEGPYIYILLTPGENDIKTLIIDFDPAYKDAYKEVLNSLEIKKVPNN
jgi:hypothetical protein